MGTNFIKHHNVCFQLLFIGQQTSFIAIWLQEQDNSTYCHALAIDQQKTITIVSLPCASSYGFQVICKVGYTSKCSTKFDINSFNLIYLTLIKIY